MINTNRYRLSGKHGSIGFTIVELLIVIVVIGILATITIVGYNGITQSARVASMKSDLRTNADLLALTLADESNYPISPEAANNGQGLKTSSGNTIQYAYIASENFYCMTVTSGTSGITPLRIDSNSGTIEEGPCKGQSAVSEPPTLTGVSSLFAGSGTAGATNGSSGSAQFSGPMGLAADYQGNVYVADTINNLIRKITSDGTVSIFAGSTTAGATNATGTAARFTAPTDIAIGPKGNIYVADAGNNRIRKITPAGVVTTFSGSGTIGVANGAAASAQFNNPTSLAVDALGNVYVADTNNHTIRKIDSNGTATTLVGSPGVAGAVNGSGTVARFSSPSGIALDKDGNIYVADTANNRIRQITSLGVASTWAGSGTAGTTNATGASARFNAPIAISVDSSGVAYVADTGNNRIRKITADRVVTTFSGSGTVGYANGSTASTRYDGPTGIAMSPLGDLYVGDTGNNRIRKIN